MNEPALSMTGRLATELATNDQQATLDKPLRFSVLKQMGRSPMHCLHAMHNNYEPTLAMRLGSSVHSLLLGGPPVVTYTGKVRRGKDYEAWLADQQPDAIIVTAKEEFRARGMVASVHAHAAAERILFGPDVVFESTIHWEWMGQKFRSTPDARTKSHLVDLKTTRDATPDRFQWDARKAAYNAQLYTYAKAMEWENGFEPKQTYLIAVESAAPHPVTVHELTPRTLEHGGRLARAWLESLIACRTSGVWSGYSDAVVEFDTPLDIETDLVFGDDEDEASE